MWQKITSNKFLFFTFLYFFVGSLFLLFFSIAMLPPGTSVVGHDSGMPLDAKIFWTSRFFAWDPRDGFGTDNSHLFGSITIHFIDYLSSVIGNTTYAGNWFNLFFWFWAIFIAALLFAYALKDIFGKYFTFLFPPLIIFNFFIFQSVFILERAKYSVFVATLLFLFFAQKTLDRKISPLKSSIGASLVMFLFNSGSLLGIPLYGGLIVIILSFLFFNLALDFINKNFSTTKLYIKFLVLTLLWSVLLNSYQIFPYIQGVRSSKYTANLFSSSLGTTLEWVNYISQNTSLGNLFRLEGVPTWYIDTNVINAEHKYASQYLGYPLLIFVSLLVPIIAFSSILIANKKPAKKLTLFFAFVSLIGMMFAAGTHAPFGFIYAFLFEKLPGFILFRTPYYKFASSFILGISVLFAYTISFFIGCFTKDKGKLGFLSMFLIIVLVFCYQKPLLSADNNFTWEKGFSTKAIIPSYVYDTQKWVEENSSDQSVLLVPPVNPGDLSDGYKWGYWSLSPLTYSLSSSNFISNSSTLSDEERAWVYMIYDLIKKKQESQVIDLARRLNIKFLLFRDDVQSEERKIYKEALQAFSGVYQTQQFGSWSVYSLNNNEANEVRVLPQSYLLPVKQEYLSREIVRNLGYGVSEMGTNSLPLVNIFTKQARSQECISCRIEQRNSINRLDGSRVLPNSPLYPLKEARDEKSLEALKDDRERLSFYLNRSLRKLSEVASILALGFRDEDLVISLKRINESLNEIHSILSDTDKYSSDFVIQKSVNDYLEFIGNYLGRYSEIENFYARSNKVREEILAVLWNIKKIRNLYPSTLIDIEQWNYKKIFDLTFDIKGSYQLYFLPSSFHQDEESFLLPTSIELSKNDKVDKITLSNDSPKLDRWLTVDIGNHDAGKEKLTMTFDSFPNIFVPKGLSLEDFANGKKGCYTGSIKNFTSSKKYLVKLTLGDGNTDMTMLFRDPKKLYSASNEFIQGEERVDIGADVTNYKYIYYPLTNPSGINIYICKKNESMPSIKEIVVHEIFEPFLVSLANKDESDPAIPLVTYEKINSIKYKVQIKNAQSPFTLALFNRFDTNWRINKDEKDNNYFSKFVSYAKDLVGSQSLDKNHVKIDGYANGWIVSDTGSYNLTIEYTPQNSFYIGCIVTVIVLLLIVFLFFKHKSSKLN